MSHVPKHRNPSSERSASAPYNFIPLPDSVVRAVDHADELPDHSTIDPDLNTGHIDVLLETKSPLYIRAPQPSEEFREGDGAKRRDAGPNENGFRALSKHRPEFYHRGDPSRPVIPGSSLKGMLRTMVEIAGHGRMTRVTGKQLFYRTMDGSVVSVHYNGRMGGHVQCGFLRARRGDYKIIPANGYRLSYNVSKPPLNGNVPAWSSHNGVHQHGRVHFMVTGDRVSDVQPARGGVPPGWKEGMCVIGGGMYGKKHDYIFELPSNGIESISVPDEVIERFNDDDQITPHQQSAFPKDKPRKKARPRDGELMQNPPHPGEPVFFLVEKDEDGKEVLVFLGRTKMFRLPYQNSPLDLVPKHLRKPEDIDFAEALFGYIRTNDELKDLGNPKQGTKQQAYGARVSISDAVLDGVYDNLFLNAFSPRILASPKPTSFQLYLTQDTDDKKGLRHYDDDPQHTTIRGYKRYWPQGDRTQMDLAAEEKDVTKSPKQYTYIKPVRSGVTFRFRVHFENLSDAELGALCWAIKPAGRSEKEYVHALGMGKPYGMGAVKLDARLELQETRSRYSSLFENADWSTGLRHAEMTPFRDTFERKVLEMTGAQGALGDIPRIAYLLKMMEWKGFRPQENKGLYLHDDGRPNTRYMRIEGSKKNEYKDRHVLPDPAAFDSGIPEDERPDPRSDAEINELTRREPRSRGRGDGKWAGHQAEYIVDDGPVIDPVPPPIEAKVRVTGLLSVGVAVRAVVVSSSDGLVQLAADRHDNLVDIRCQKLPEDVSVGDWITVTVSSTDTNDIARQVTYAGPSKPGVIQEQEQLSVDGSGNVARVADQRARKGKVEYILEDAAGDRLKCSASDVFGSIAIGDIVTFEPFEEHGILRARNVRKKS